MDVRDLDEDSQFSDGEGNNPETTVQYEQTTSVLFRWSRSKRANSISTSSLPITYQVDASASADPPESFPSLTVQERDEVLAELFTDNNGDSIDLGESPHQPDSLNVSSTHSLPFLRRTTTIETTISHWTFSVIDGMSMKLGKLVELVEQHVLLRRIEIVSSECYKQKSNGILHRFLVLALRRKGKPPVWLRLDRRMDHTISRRAFLLASSQSPANDTAIFSADKNDLIKEAQYESRQQFETLTTLDDLRHLLQIICEELVLYQLWPANCWFFVSLLQQHLQGDRRGYFVDGSIKWGETAQAVRSRVDERLRLIYHIPLPLTTKNILLSLKGRPELNTTVRALVRQALPPKNQSQWIVRDDLRTVTASFPSGTKSAELLKEIAYHLYYSAFNLEAIYIQQQTVKIGREIHKRDVLNDGHRVPDAQGRRALFERVQTNPYLHRANLASYLNRLGVYLHNTQRYGDACATHQEAVMLARELFEADPGSHRATLAGYLHSLGISLHLARRYSDACAAHQEAVMLARELFEADPGSYRGTLALYLHELGNSLHMSQRYSDACATDQEAVMLARELFEADPGSHRATLAGYLHSLGISLHEAQRYSDACAAKQEAVMLARELFEADPGSHRATLAGYLHSLGISLHEAQRYRDACAIHQEAVMLARELVEADPGSHSTTLTSYLYELGFSLRGAQHYSHASDTVQEAIQYQRHLFNYDKALHRDDLLVYFNFYVQVLEDQGLWAEIPVIRAQISQVESP